MKINKKYLLAGLVPVFALALVGAATASAHGNRGGDRELSEQEREQHKQERLAKLSEITGISPEDLEQARADGKSLETLATERGLNFDDLKQQLSDARKQHMEERLKQAVFEGRITQEQADEKLQKMQERANHGPPFGRHGNKH